MSHDTSPPRRAPQERRVTDASTHPHLEPLASYAEYLKRLEKARGDLMTQLGRLGPEWVVCGTGRLEGWGLGAMAVGPPGIFLLWPIAGSPEPMLCLRSDECRQWVQREVGAQWPGVVEIVFYLPHSKPGSIERDVSPHGERGDSWNVLYATGWNLHELLSDWEPASGVYIAAEWLEQFADSAQERWKRPDGDWMYGPDAPARRAALVQSPHFLLGE